MRSLTLILPICFFLRVQETLAETATDETQKKPIDDDPQYEANQHIDELLATSGPYFVVYQSYDNETTVSCMTISPQDSPDDDGSVTRTLLIKYRESADWSKHNITVNAASYQTAGHDHNNALNVTFHYDSPFRSSTSQSLPESGLAESRNDESTTVANAVEQHFHNLQYKLMYYNKTHQCAVVRILDGDGDCEMLVSKEKVDAANTTSCMQIYSNNCNNTYLVYNSTCKEESLDKKAVE